MYLFLRRMVVLVLCLSGLSFSQTPLLNHPSLSLQENTSGSHESNLPEMMFQASSSEKKNVTIAAGLSLLLPGMGELYVGDYSFGKYLSITEGALWLTYASFQVYGDWVKNDARTFAVQHAGIASIDMSTQYFIDIGNFVSVDSYNEQMLIDRNPGKIYDPNSSKQWNWDSDDNREQYRQLRVSSDAAYNNSDFVLAAIGVNHIISAINAGRLAIKHNKKLDEAGTLDFHANVLGTLTNPNGIMLTASLKF